MICKNNASVNSITYAYTIFLFPLTFTCFYYGSKPYNRQSCSYTTHLHSFNSK